MFEHLFTTIEARETSIIEKLKEEIDDSFRSFRMKLTVIVLSVKHQLVALLD